MTYAEAKQIAADTVNRCPLPKLTPAQRQNLEMAVATQLLNASSRGRDAATS